jgi:small subunit ribosomal protein S5
MQSIVLQLRGLTLVGAGACSNLRSAQRQNICQFVALGYQNGHHQYHTSTSLSSFYNSKSADELWKTMAGVSAQGKKRGRARGMLRQKNLNRGQVIGFGKKKTDFPGLTSNPTEKQGQTIKLKKIEEMSDKVYNKYEDDLAKIRELGNQKRKRRKDGAMDRGWAGGKIAGKRFGAPQAVNKELKFDNFTSTILEFKMVFKMTGNLGRVRRTSALMVTGNGNGTFGYSVTAGRYGQNARTLKAAVNRAGLRLLNIERYEERTVFHDFFTQFGNTRIFVEQRPYGFGISAHRSIKAICEKAGIKDIYCKLEGATNMQHITKAFILGLLRQKTHQDLADEKQLHLIEMRPEEDYYPRLVATPSDGKVRTQAEIEHNEVLDFKMISYEGQLPMERVKRNPFEGHITWDLRQRRLWAYESHERVRRRMRVENGDEHGAVRSHLYDKYPECIEEKAGRKEKSSE